MLQEGQQRLFAADGMGQLRLRGPLQGIPIQAVLLEEFVQSRPADANVPSGFHELQHVLA
jgi:hypothetical protein